MLFVSSIYIYQGISSGIFHRWLFGVIILIFTIIALYAGISSRYAVTAILLEDGILAGIKEKRIIKKFDYPYSFLPYSAISNIDVKKVSSELRVLQIRTLDNKLWRKNRRHYEGIMLNKKEVDKYLTTIYEQMGKIKDKST